MALPNTDTLDIPGRGLPAVYIINLTTGPNIDTDTLDVPSRGLPAEYIQNVTPAVAVTVKKLAAMGVG